MRNYQLKRKFPNEGWKVKGKISSSNTIKSSVSHKNPIKEQWRRNFAMGQQKLHWGNFAFSPSFSLCLLFAFGCKNFLFFLHRTKRLGREGWHRHRTDFFWCGGKIYSAKFSLANRLRATSRWCTFPLFFAPCFSCHDNWTINVQCLFNCALFYAHLTLFALTC